MGKTKVLTDFSVSFEYEKWERQKSLQTLAFPLNMKNGKDKSPYRL
jgi:hypothetical protein